MPRSTTCCRREASGGGRGIGRWRLHSIDNLYGSGGYTDSVSPDPTWRHRPPFDDNDRRVMLVITGLCLGILATPFLLLVLLMA